MTDRDRDYCRDKFEEWADKEMLDVTRTDEGGIYLYEMTRCYWTCWRAAWEEACITIEIVDHD